jgi:hypothetical protein
MRFKLLSCCKNDEIYGRSDLKKPCLEITSEVVAEPARHWVLPCSIH